MTVRPLISGFFFKYATPTEIYTLSLHDALPISSPAGTIAGAGTAAGAAGCWFCCSPAGRDRKSTRLNSSHPSISYAVFCLKKKNNTDKQRLAYKRMHKEHTLYTVVRYSTSSLFS